MNRALHSDVKAADRWGFVPMMLRCLWIRGRIAAYVDRALPEGRTRAVARHLDGCGGCRELARQQERLITLVRGLAVEATEPEWIGFWPELRTRILSEAPLAGRLSTHLWWEPGSRLHWRFGWLPRLALGSGIAAVLALGLVFWQSGYRAESPEPGIVVRSVEMAHPDTSVMVFAAPGQEMTVIWVFGLDPSADQSRRQSEETKVTWRPRLPGSSWS